MQSIKRFLIHLKRLMQFNCIVIAYYYIGIAINHYSFIDVLICIVARSKNQINLGIDLIRLIHSHILYICNKGIESFFYNPFYKAMNPVFYIDK